MEGLVSSVDPLASSQDSPSAVKIKNKRISVVVSDSSTTSTTITVCAKTWMFLKMSANAQ